MPGKRYSRTSVYGHVPGELIDGVRVHLGLSVREFSAALGLTKTTLKTYRDKGGPPIMRYALAGLVAERGGSFRQVLHVLRGDQPDVLQLRAPQQVVVDDNLLDSL